MHCVQSLIILYYNYVYKVKVRLLSTVVKRIQYSILTARTYMYMPAFLHTDACCMSI